MALGYPDTKIAAQEAIRKNVFLKHRRAFYQFGFDNKDFHQKKSFIHEAGLYRLMLRSRKPGAAKFSSWVVEIALPNIRKFGYYKLSEEHKRQYAEIMQKISFIEEENKRLKQDNKKNTTYPNGGLVYVIDYSNKYENIFRIGKTTDMKMRKKIYDTHTLHDQPVVFFEETGDPHNLESCVIVLLHKYRYNNNKRKDFFECSLKTIKSAFKKCIENFTEMANQTGGGKKSLMKNIMSDARNDKVIIQNRITKLDKKIARLDTQIKTEQKSLKIQFDRKKCVNSGSKTAKLKTRTK